MPSRPAKSGNTPRGKAKAPSHGAPPASGKKSLPARPGGPRIQSKLRDESPPKKRRSTVVRVVELFVLAACLGVLYFPVSHYLRTGRPLDPFSEAGRSYIRDGVAEGRQNLRQSYGYVKSKLPETAGELKGWLEERGQKLPSTEQLLAMATDALEAGTTSDSETAVDSLGGDLKITEADKQKFRREQAARARRLAEEEAAKDAAAMKRLEARLREKRADAPADGPAPTPDPAPDVVPAAAERVEAPPPVPDETLAGEPPPEVEVASTDQPVVRSPGPEPPPVAPATTGSAPGAKQAANADLEKGRAFYREAMSHFRKTRPSNPRWQEELGVSRGLFRKAQMHLQRASNADPSNAEIEVLITRTNMFLYDCMKRTTLKL